VKSEGSIAIHQSLNIWSEKKRSDPGEKKPYGARGKVGEKKKKKLGSKQPGAIRKDPKKKGEGKKYAAPKDRGLTQLGGIIRGKAIRLKSQEQG